MKEAYYFPHDTNATQDPKIFLLLTSCGIAGIGMYWIIIEILHQQKDGMMTVEEYKNTIEFYCSTNNQVEGLSDKIQQVLNKTELVLNKDGFVYSERVLRNKEMRQELSDKRSLAGKRSAELRLKNNAFSTSVEQVSTSVEQGKERKGKEKKENTTTTAPDKLVADVVDKSLPVNWENCRSDHQRFIAYYVAKEMPELYKNATQAQANGLFKRYGRAASEVLSVSGDIDTARAAFDLGRAYFVQKGLPWNLSTISKNIGEFVNSVITNKRSIK